MELRIPAGCYPEILDKERINKMENIKILRLLVYEGPRDIVERTLLNSVIQGSQIYGRLKITSVYLQAIPTVVELSIPEILGKEIEDK